MKITYLILLTNIITIFSYIESSYYVLYLASFFFNFLLLFSIFLSYLNIKKLDKNEIFYLIKTTINNSLIQKTYKKTFLLISVISFSLAILFSIYFKEYVIAFLSTTSFLFFILNIKFLNNIKKEYYLLEKEKEKSNN